MHLFGNTQRHVCHTSTFPKKVVYFPVPLKITSGLTRGIPLGWLVVVAPFYNNLVASDSLSCEELALSLYSNVIVCYEYLFASHQKLQLFSSFYGNFLYVAFTFLKKPVIICSFKEKWSLFQHCKLKYL